jgi:CheY-like chemotaxis protein
MPALSKVILLVEDNASDEKLALLAFKGAGVNAQIDVVRNGAEALDYLFGTGNHVRRAGGDGPSLVLLDLKLPKVNGQEVIRRARAADHTRLVPIVVLTASNEEEDVLASLSLGANAYVRKPVDFGEFTHAAQVISSFWLHLNEVPPLQRSKT